jgi:hypothetical protein
VPRRAWWVAVALLNTLRSPSPDCHIDAVRKPRTTIKFLTTRVPVALLALLLSACTARRPVDTSTVFQGSAVSTLWTREELFLGLNRPNGPPVTDLEFESFIVREVATRLCCFTILNTTGYYTPNPGTPGEREAGRVLVVMYSDADKDVAGKLTAIAQSYVKTFSQESVLRVASRVNATFIR